MSPIKIIKLGKKDDIASAVKHIKNMREKEAVFELDEKSPLLRSSDNMKLMKKTAESLGKKITVSTDDEIGLILAKKAGVLADDVEVSMPKRMTNRRRPMRSAPTSRVSDISNSSRVVTTEKTVDVSDRFSIPGISAVSDVITAPKRMISKTSWMSKFRTPRSKHILAGLSVVVIASLLLAIFLPAATITIHARSESITRDFEITVDSNLTQADNMNLEIPGVIVNKEKSLTKHYQATGTQATGAPAAGAVTLYNFTGNTLTLRQSTTTLVTDDGRKYLFTKDVTGLRATGGTEQNPNESTLIDPVSVVAEQPGEAYNLAANTRFKVVNAALGQQNVYGINAQAITGGSATATTVVSEDDVNRAADSLVNDILTETADELSSQHGTTVKLVDSGLKKEVLAKSTSVDINQAADSFDLTGIVRLTGIGFKHDDVVSLVTSKINQVLSADKYLPEGSTNEYTATFKNYDPATGRGVLAVHFVTRVAYKVNSDNMSKLLAGKNAEEIEEILLAKPEVDSVEVSFWPPWLVHKAPRLNGKVHIQTVLTNK